MPSALRISQTVDWGDLDAEEGEFAVDAAAIPPRAVMGFSAARMHAHANSAYELSVFSGHSHWLQALESGGRWFHALGGSC
jgi:hypothetical protein